MECALALYVAFALYTIAKQNGTKALTDALHVAIVAYVGTLVSEAVLLCFFFYCCCCFCVPSEYKIRSKEAEPLV